MKNPVYTKLLKDIQYCAKEIGRDIVTPNIILHVLSLDKTVCGHLQFSHADTQLLEYVFNPYHRKYKSVSRVVLSHEAKEILDDIAPTDTYMDVFKKTLRHKYIREIVSKIGYMPEDGEVGGLLEKYTNKIEGSIIRENDTLKYKKIHDLLDRKNVMVMGAPGAGRYDFIKSFAKYYKHEFVIYYFDLFSCLKVEEDRLFGIISGIFHELGENYLYIPNFLQTVEWLKSLKKYNCYTLLEETSMQGKIITKVNKGGFDTKQFHLSQAFNFNSINTPYIPIDELYDLLNMHAVVYEKFYGISISHDIIKLIVKDANIHDKLLAQPGKSLKRLMRTALSLYGNSDIMENPRSNHSLYANTSVEMLLNKHIFGQSHALYELTYELSKLNFSDIGTFRSYLFQGEVGCGKLKSAREFSQYVFGEDAFRYLDASGYNEYPFKTKIYNDLDTLLKTFYGGVLYLDNIDYIDTSYIDIIEYIKSKVLASPHIDVMAPVFIIASTRLPITEMHNYKYVIEHFDKIIPFEKLTVRDLEKIADIEIKKAKGVVNTQAVFDAFSIGARANTSFNAISVKKIITSLSA